MSPAIPVEPDSPAALINRELSWLSFARRVLALAEDPEEPALERVKFAGIMGNLGLNLAVLVTEPGRQGRRFVRIKVPANRSRWVPLRNLDRADPAAIFAEIRRGDILVHRNCKTSPRGSTPSSEAG
jgi:polyphosphate kinase